MQYGICTLSLVPARKEPAGTSEMVTQLLFGEHYTVLENSGDWIRISTASDNYECWISDKQHTKIPENIYQALGRQDPVYAGELVQIIHDRISGNSFPVTIGATLPFYKNKSSVFAEFDFGFEGATARLSEKHNTQDVVSTAFLFMNAPYLWGGKSPFGIDCSGFIQLVYQLNGFKLPRDASQQVELGEPLSFADEAEAGDLAFFDNEEGRIVHVGLLLNNKQIIHASGSVRIDNFDHYGIHHSDRKAYTHTLRVIKRVM
jgi:gamma-D-glutamyl-L-lysine dipeptidyl-peptidase